MEMLWNYGSGDIASGCGFDVYRGMEQAVIQANTNIQESDMGGGNVLYIQ